MSAQRSSSNEATAVRERWQSPLAWVLLGMLALRLVGISWGLPASDAWEDDGIAPRDFLVGAHETYLPGHFFTYPPVHLLGLTVLTSPVWGWALAHARSLAQTDVVAAMIQVPTMTALTLVARAVSAVMSLGIAWGLAKIAEEIRGKRAAVFVALVVASDVVLTYYGHTSNLDAPYLFWGCLGLLELARAIARTEPRRLRRALLFAALAVGTKDQAYALFLLAVPVAIAMWIVLEREKTRGILRELSIAIAVAAALLLLVDGAITNPSGFARRVAFLLGPASQEHANFPTGWEGRLAIIKELAQGFDRFHPWPFAVLIAAGLADHFRNTRGDRARLTAGLVPLFAAVSFVVCFNFTARRTEHRFALPPILFLSLYAGLALDSALGACTKAWQRALAAGGAAALFAWSLFDCAAVDANLLLDPRYDAEAFLRAHVESGDLIEVYGSNAYLPRLPAGASATRVDIAPLGGRNPLPRVVEVEARFEDVESRRPRWIVVPEAWAWRYRIGPPPPGHILAAGQAARQNDLATRAYFASLYDGRGSYALAHLSDWTSTFWPRADIHASTARPVRIFERRR
jgi:hypothetical protein